VAPNPDLSKDQQAAVAAEHNMPSNHQLKLSLRKSMLFYLNARFSSAPTSLAAAHQLVVLQMNES
jgi:hypothetical protein